MLIYLIRRRSELYIKRNWNTLHILDILLSSHMFLFFFYRKIEPRCRNDCPQIYRSKTHHRPRKSSHFVFSFVYCINLVHTSYPNILQFITTVKYIVREFDTVDNHVYNAKQQYQYLYQIRYRRRDMTKYSLDYVQPLALPSNPNTPIFNKKTKILELDRVADFLNEKPLVCDGKKHYRSRISLREHFE